MFPPSAGDSFLFLGMTPPPIFFPPKPRSLFCGAPPISLFARRCDVPLACLPRSRSRGRETRRASSVRGNTQALPRCPGSAVRVEWPRFLGEARTSLAFQAFHDLSPPRCCHLCPKSESRVGRFQLPPQWALKDSTLTRAEMAPGFREMSFCVGFTFSIRRGGPFLALPGVHRVLMLHPKGVLGSLEFWLSRGRLGRSCEWLACFLDHPWWWWARVVGWCGDCWR